MLFGTNKEKGNAGMAMAIAYFGANGYTVSIPLNDTQDYDLIVDNNSCLQKVQVKASGAVQASGSYEVSLVNTGGTRGEIYGRVCESSVDLVFILTEDKAMYLIPIEELRDNRKSVKVSKTNNYSKFLVQM